MPYVRIEWVKGQSADKRAEVSRRVNAAVSEATGIPSNSIWVVFEEIEADSWFVGEKSVAQIRSGS